MRTVDYRLNALVDAGLVETAPLAELARHAAENGATLIQYRDKYAKTRQMIERAVEIRNALEPTGVPLVVNDRVDVTLAAEAVGVHLGADDMDPETARRLLGPDAIIGLTVKNASDGARAAAAPVDYACIGGVFHTLSKINSDPPVGVEGFRALRRGLKNARPDLPVGAIAGIKLEHVPELIADGADGIAVISAIFHAPDVTKATRDFRRAVDAALAIRAR
ncbi:thiamine phosphate synthase [Martelella sp. AD-3]|uniref:thiamine phosphate synthase n=1 Tax=Martelella sp. AD-3 TaxID=686597 RepID=UPI00046798BA|nr:thiamine phosphate synthase [Martelella sp. AD-3]AMM85787.1 thiamine-phosphate pyrophosphorylase [Martelella sp. AD-3]